MAAFVKERIELEKDYAKRLEALGKKYYSKWLKRGGIADDNA
jgi:hypothetical protein